MEWIKSLLNGESGSAVQLVLITLGLVLALILIFWMFRRIVGTPARRAARNRVPRLSITDVTAVDDKRFLVLARRDNVEHLVLIGGPTDVVVESGIVRTKQPQASQPVSRGKNVKPAAKTETVPATETISNKEAAQEPMPEKAPPEQPAPVVAVTGVTAAAATTVAAVKTATETTSTIAENISETVTETAESVSETVEVVSNATEPEIQEQEVLEVQTSAAEAETDIIESDLEATLSDALSTEELSVDLGVEEPSSVEVLPDDVAAGSNSDASPDDEMQKLLAELANETKEPV